MFHVDANTKQKISSTPKRFYFHGSVIGNEILVTFQNAMERERNALLIESIAIISSMSKSCLSGKQNRFRNNAEIRKNP